MKHDLQTAETIRKFNRVYLPYFHLLDQKYLGTEYSVTEARILYEIYDREGLCATDIVQRFHVDKGYLSRILKKFQSRGLIRRVSSEEDSRIRCITLTENGKQLTQELIGKSNQQISDDIADLAAEELHALSVHLQAVMDLIEDTSV